MRSRFDEQLDQLNKELISMGQMMHDHEKDRQDQVLTNDACE